ncbi:MAG: DUF4337 family protein [Caulobacterales bacterium]|jgi:hypothetical protein
MADDTGPTSDEQFNNRVALSIALIATFLAVSTIKSGNVEQSLAQAQAERNNSWAWYQAVRVREDMATYELANLKRAAHSNEVAAQEEELRRIRDRLAEVSGRAKAAEKDLERLNALADQYDLSDALIAIAMSLLAVCALVRNRPLYWFGFATAAAGAAWASASMAGIILPARQWLAWLI